MSLLRTINNLHEGDYSPAAFLVQTFEGINRTKLVYVDIDQPYGDADQGVSSLRLGTTPTFR